MLIKYEIHKIGTPTLALPNTPGFYTSQWWNENGEWDRVFNAKVFDTKDHPLPENGEWVETYVNESPEQCIECNSFLLATENVQCDVCTRIIALNEEIEKD